MKVLQTSALPLGYDATSDSYGIWTHVTAVKGRCLNHLTKEPDSPSRTWTYDSAVNSRVLYRLSYRGLAVSQRATRVLYDISMRLSTLFSNFFNFFEAFSFFEDVLEWVSLTIISSPTLFVKGFCKKIFHCIFQQNILWIFCRSVAKLQTFRFTAKLNSLLAVRQDNLAIYRII